MATLLNTIPARVFRATSGYRVPKNRFAVISNPIEARDSQTFTAATNTSQAFNLTLAQSFILVDGVPALSATQILTLNQVTSGGNLPTYSPSLVFPFPITAKSVSLRYFKPLVSSPVVASTSSFLTFNGGAVLGTPGIVSGPATTGTFSQSISFNGFFVSGGSSTSTVTGTLLIIGDDKPYFARANSLIEAPQNCNFNVVEYYL